MKKKTKFILGAVLLLCLTLTLGWTQELFPWWGNPTQVEAAPHAANKTGHATWYNLCNGHNGACGDCDNTKLHAAWPHLDQTNCHRYCSSVSSLSCGSNVQIRDWCPGLYMLGVQIHDCCTCNGPGGCSGNSRCNGTIWNGGEVIIDLTTTAFIGLHGSLGDGRIPVTVYY